MSTTALRTRRRLGVVLASALALGGLVALAPTATAAQTGAPVADSGTATWGISDYLNAGAPGRPGPAATAYAAPASYSATTKLSTFAGGNPTGTIAADGSAVLAFKGASVNWAAGTGNGWLRLADPIVTVDATGTGTVSAEVSFGTTPDGTTWTATPTTRGPQRIVIENLTPDAEVGDAGYPTALSSLTYGFSATATKYTWSNLIGRWSNEMIAFLATNDGTNGTGWTFKSTVVNGAPTSSISRYPSAFNLSFDRAVAATTATPSVDGDGVTIAVAGTGFLKTSPGIYVSLRERANGDAPYAGGSLAADAPTAWVSNNAADVGPDPATQANASIAEDGSFAVDLKLDAAAVAKLDPAKSYTIVTRKGHGQGTIPANANQVTEIPVDLAGLKQTTTVAASNVGIPLGATAVVNATVTPATSGTPTGSVLVKDGSTTVGTGTLSGGTAAISVAGLAPGSKAYTLEYAGDSGYWKSAGTVTIAVAVAGTSVTPVLDGSGIKITVDGVGFLDTAPGVYVSLRERATGDAAYAGGSLGDAPTAWVSNDAADIGPDPLTGAAAAIAGDGSFSVDLKLDAAAVAKLDPAKSYTIVTRKAHGQGTIPANASQITEIAVDVAALKQTTTVAAPNASATVGANAVVQATVTPATSGVPSGTVTVLDGATVKGTGTLSAGKATITLTGLPVGTKSYALRYSGADGYWKSAGSVSVAIAKRATKITVTGASSVAYRTASTYTATVSAGATGNVVLTGAGTAITKKIAGGKATFVLPTTLTAGKKSLKFSYAASATDTATSTTKSVTVKKGAATISLTVVRKAKATKAGRVTVTLKSTKGGPVPTGKVTVKLTKGGVTKTLSAKVLKGGKVTFDLPKVPKGSWTLKLGYTGSTQHDAVTRSIKVTVAK